MAFKPIQIIINAKDNASAVFGRLEGKVKAVGIAVAGYFGIKAFAGGIQGAADFEAAMSRVKAATDGTAEEMQQLTKAAQDAGANTKYTGIEAAGALENLAKAGLSAGDAVKALPAVLALAQVGDVELATASEYVTKAVMGMGLAFEDAARVSDVLAKGANATNTSVEGLAQALSYAAPVANTLGLSLESTVAIIGKFADAGIDASRAGTALNSILSQFANPASTFRKELGAAGIVTDDFEQALRQLAAKGPAGAKAINAVGMEAGPALRALLNQGVGALDELTQKLNNAQGSAAAAAKTMSDNFNGSVKSLSSVWSAAVDVLNTPVLPVLRKGVDELTAAIRRSIEDGTVAKFGQTLATAFEQGMAYFRAFAQNVNFDAVMLRLQVFASETQATLQRIGQYATNAGNTVQLAWGVMTAGVNGVLAVVYKVGEAFAGVASNIQSGLALIYQGLSKVTFGVVSQAYAKAAQEIRESAQATWAVSEALAEKSSESFNAMADSAQLARDGWAGLTAQVEPAAAGQQQVAEALQSVTQAMQEQAAQVDAVAKKQDQKTASDALSREALQGLRQEYAALIDGGNLQAAAKKLQEIDKAQQALSGSAQQAAQGTALLEQAYKDLGLKTNQELQDMAAQARAAFDALSADGTQPPQRIAQAWKVMAERVIEANGGVAPSWLKVQASVRDFQIAVDNAGKSVVSTEEATLKATGRMAKGFDAVGESADRAGERMEGLRKQSDRQHEQPFSQGGTKPPLGQRPSGDYNGLRLTPEQQHRIDELRNSGDHLVAANELRKIKWQQEKDQSDKERAERSAANAQSSQAAREKVKDLNTGGSDRDLFKEMFGGNTLQSLFPKGAMTLQLPTMPAAPMAPMGGAAQSPGAVITRRHELLIGGREFAVPTTQDGSEALERLLQELERGAGLAGGRR